MPPSWTQAGRGPSSGPGMVGIDVAADVHAAGAGIVDELQHGVDLGPVLTAPHLDVRDLHPDPAVLADADGLGDRRLHGGGLAPHVGEVQAARVAIERARPTSSSVVAYALGG